MGSELALIALSAMLVNNFVLARFLGVCPFLGVSRRMDSAVGMSVAVLFVMTVASLATWLVQRLVLTPFGLDYLRTISFILIIAALVQLVEMVVQKSSPVLYQALGIFLPLITTNCAILGVALLVQQKDYGFLQTMTFAVAASVGFGLAMVLLAGLRESLALASVPRSFQGNAIVLVTAGILSLAFMGFSGLVRG
ncbi:MAG: electron transport complex subunit RsxA [Nitrospirota bacterium]|nr:electron transport complex subunit RsxA [Nitrospirota bacterium]